MLGPIPRGPWPLGIVKLLTLGPPGPNVSPVTLGVNGPAGPIET